MKMWHKILLFEVVLFSACLLPACVSDNKYNSSKEHSTSWYETTMQVNYRNGEIDTIEIDVFESLDESIELTDGNLSYWKAMKITGGIVAKRIRLASYVQRYEIIDTVYKTITNKD